MSAASNSILTSLQKDLLRAVWRRRFPLYLAAWIPWVLLVSVMLRYPVLGNSVGQSALYFAATILVPIAFGALDFWYWRRRIAREMLSWLNHASPNLEDSSQVLQQADSVIAQLQQQRLVQRMASVCTPELLESMALRFASAGVAWRFGLILNFLLMMPMIWSIYHFNNLQATPPHKAIANAVTDKHELQWGQLQLHIRAPSYTGIAVQETSAKDLEVAEQSEVRWCVSLQNALIEIDAQSYLRRRPIVLSNGDTVMLQAQENFSNPASSGKQYCGQWLASESVFWSWPEVRETSTSQAKDDRKPNEKAQRWTIKVIADEAPKVDIEQPKEMLQVLSLTSKELTMQVTVSDDYRVSNAQLHMTLARGSGENIRFSDKEVPIPQGSDPKLRSWKRTWSLQELGMEAGDELYFFVRVTDNAQPAPHQTTSATYTLRMPLPEVKEEATSVIPILAKPESLRSQRQIIIDTENLLADIKANPKMNALVVRNRSEIIANDQAALRRRYGKFLGEESSLFGDEEHDEHEGGHSGNNEGGKMTDMAATFGHAHDQAENATLFDEATKKILRRVLVAMWDAEKSLRAISPATALAPENKALEGIKQLQQADRIYLHKAAFTPPAIKEEKRLSGDAKDARDWKSQQAANASTLPIELVDLMRALAEDTALPANWSRTARAWIAQGLPQDEQRLAAQAAVQDVSDGCTSCKANLRAWLRQAMPAPSLLLQAPTAVSTSRSKTASGAAPAVVSPAIEKAWQASGLVPASTAKQNKNAGARP